MERIDFPLDVSLGKNLRAYMAAKAAGEQLIDCLYDEVDGDIRACINAGTFDQEQADLIEKIMQEA